MTQSLFDIVGPVMVGPSSSHTAGAVRLGLLARNIAERPIVQAECVLYNSFAQTYKGHGTDRGLVAGLMGFAVDDERIRDVLTLLPQSGFQVLITPDFSENHYPPNTVVFHLVLDNAETLTIVGHSVGGGKVYVSQFNKINVILKGDTPTLLLFYKDQPGMIWRVTKVIAEEGINIASLTCTRRLRGVEALMTIALDTQLSDTGVAEIRLIENIYTMKRIDALAL